MNTKITTEKLENMSNKQIQNLKSKKYEGRNISSWYWFKDSSFDRQ